MTVLTSVFAISVLGGLVQAVAGFGNGTVVMLVLPALYGLLKASGMTQVICAVVNFAIAWQYRSHIRWKLTILPAVLYCLFSIPAILLAKQLDLRVLSVVFGAFLVLIALYSLFLQDRTRVKDSLPAAVGCSALSGICMGLFGVGGPTMALYMVAATEDRETYLANLQAVLFAGGLISTITRTMGGILTADLIPGMAAGCIGVLAGMQLGNLTAKYMKVSLLRKIVYAVTGLTGLLTVVQQLAK